MDMKLSICVVTMNRAEQLREALQSCLECELPEKTEFVIIDNASTDNTDNVVHELMSDSGYPYCYEKMPENIGAGAGRNKYYEKANGEYVYGMDDDAIIDVEKNRDFFIRAVEILDSNPDFGTLATQIYDNAWQADRQTIGGDMVAESIYKCKMFCGGSHFLRKSVFDQPPYLSNKYGYEELPPSLISYDKGYLNVFCSTLCVIHNPAIDKWDLNNKENYEILINTTASLYAIRKMMYPALFLPMIWMAYKARIRKHLYGVPNANKKCNMIAKATKKQYYIDYKIEVRTVISLYRDHGISIF